MATSIKINDFTITEFLDFEAYERTTGYLDFKLEEMQDFSLEASQEKTELTGKNGRVIGYKKNNKKISGSGTVGMISAGLMKAQTGGEISNGSYTVKKSEIKIVNGATLTTDAKAIGTAGSEIGEIKVVALNGATTKVYTQGTAASATKFAYDPDTKTITLPTGEGAIEDGSKIMYGYDRTVSATKVTDPSDKYSEVREVWIHCMGTDACDNKYYAAIYIPRADFTGDFSLNLVGDQTVHNFTFDGMADLCNTAEGSNLFEIFIYTGEDTTETA